VKIRLRNGSGHRAYKYLIEDVDRHGNVRVYFRRKGASKARLRAAPGTPEFDAEYQALYCGTAPAATGFRPTARIAVGGSMRWLVEQYYDSAAFRGLDPETRKVRRRILDSICLRAGSFAYATMRSRDVAKLRDEKAETPEAANSRVKALRAVFGWACQPVYGLATKNPAREVAYLKSRNPDGHRTWSEDNARKFEERHPLGTKARLALDLFLYTGVRISDVACLGPTMERKIVERRPDGSVVEVEKLVFTEKKGRGQLVKNHQLPILPPLRTSIDAYSAAHPNRRHLVYLVTAFDRPYTVKGLGNWFARQCRLAGLDPDLSSHGIRKFGAVRDRAAAHGIVRLGQPETGGAIYAQGQPRSPRSNRRAAARSTYAKQKCPTFADSGIRWDNQAKKALKISDEFN
jgi:integrase